MQTKKDEIYYTILNTAEREFLESGFQDTKMRTIAGKSDVSLSNIYNYFKNKDMILEECLAPAIKALDETIEDHYNEAYMSASLFTSREYIQKQKDIFVNLIRKHKTKIFILFFRTGGSSLDGFRERFIDDHTRAGKEYLKLFKEKNPSANVDVSDFFIHIMSAWWASIVGELVMHDLDQMELEHFFVDYIEFGTAGWKKVLQM